MSVCAELGKDLYEVAHWTLNDLLRWVAFFKVRSKHQEEAIAKARRNNPVGSGKGKGRINTQVIND